MRRGQTDRQTDGAGYIGPAEGNGGSKKPELNWKLSKNKPNITQIKVKAKFEIDCHDVTKNEKLMY